MKHEINQPLCIKNGKFMRGNTEVAPVIGDREQIALLQQAERQMKVREEQAKYGKLKVEIWAEDIRYDAVCQFTCVCGNIISYKEAGYACDFSDIEYLGDFEDAVFDCPVCHRSYEINGGHAKLV